MMSVVRRFVAMVCVLALAGTATAEVEFDFVLVGDAGNAGDFRYDLEGLGTVSYDFYMATTEVTNAQFCEFLNAVAVDDVNYLWRDDMGQLYNAGGIEQHGELHNYWYTVVEERANWPVNWVNQYGAMRFANWLQNGQPVGDQEPGITETGSYNLSVCQDYYEREEGAQFYVPSADEWHKAAFYKGGGLDAGYWDYATSHDELPVAEAPPGGDNSANYDEVLGWWLTDVGSYVNTVSPYGVFNMAGNVTEWTDSYSEEDAYIVGGSFFSDNRMHASNAMEEEEEAEHDLTLGFRIIRIIPHLAGDLDGDGDVDLADLAQLLACYGAELGDPNYLEEADLDGSGVIDLADLSELLSHYGETV